MNYEELVKKHGKETVEEIWAASRKQTIEDITKTKSFTTGLEVMKKLGFMNKNQEDGL